MTLRARARVNVIRGTENFHLPRVYVVGLSFSPHRARAGDHPLELIET